MIPTSPTTSGKEEVFDTTTFAPQDNASKGGIPNPSYKTQKAKNFTC